MTFRITVRFWLGIALLLVFNASLRVAASKSRPKVCRVHHVLLLQGKAKVEYGLSSWDEAAQVYRQASRQMFPNANTYINGGCLKDKDSPEEAEVQFCPECRVTENTYFAAWMQHFNPGVISNRKIEADIANAKKTLRQMTDLLDNIRQRQNPE